MQKITPINIGAVINSISSGVTSEYICIRGSLVNKIKIAIIMEIGIIISVFKYLYFFSIVSLLLVYL
jgi:hypothetical protein